jgi:hypothetical protein
MGFFFDNTAVVKTSCNACGGSKTNRGSGMGGNLATSGVDADMETVIESAVALGPSTVQSATMTAIDFAQRIGMIDPLGAADVAVMDTVRILNRDVTNSISIVMGAANIGPDLAKDVVGFFQRMN